jgi:hypothetical protein
VLIFSAVVLVKFSWNGFTLRRDMTEPKPSEQRFTGTLKAQEKPGESRNTVQIRKEGN